MRSMTEADERHRATICGGFSRASWPDSNRRPLACHHMLGAVSVGLRLADVVPCPQEQLPTPLLAQPGKHLIHRCLIAEDSAAAAQIMHPGQRRTRFAVELVSDRRHPLELLADDERATRCLADVVAKVGSDSRERRGVCFPDRLED